MAILSILLVLIIAMVLGVYVALQQNLWISEKPQDIEQAATLLNTKFSILLYILTASFLLLGTIIFLDMLNISNQWLALVFYIMTLLLSMFTLYNAHIIFGQITKFRTRIKQNKNPV